jgi:presenilin-like A22 family membrane protease
MTEKGERAHGARWMIPALFFLAGTFVVCLIRAAVAGLPAASQPWLSAWQYVALAVLSVVVTGALLKRAQSRFLWEALFAFAVCYGTWFVFLLLGLSTLPAAASALALAVVHLFLRNAAIQDIFFFLGCTGAAILFASWFPPELLILLLVAFTVYDMVAGPPGGPIERLAKKLVSFGLIPGFVFPSALKGFLGDVEDLRKDGWVLLGTGDVILPVSLVASAAMWGAFPGLAVTLGMLLGSLFLVARPDLHPRAALPPLAAGAAVPFVIMIFLRDFIL